MIQKPKPYPFIDLTNDRNFKTFFSNNKKLLLSLLKTFLPLPTQKSIKSFEFIQDQEQDKERNQLILTDPYLYSPSLRDKQVVLDLNVQLNTGEKVDVEMQVADKKAFVERVLLYWSRLFNQGLEKSDNYTYLSKTYSVIFTKFPVFGDYERGFISSFSIRSDKPPHFVLSEYLRMVFVELSRFQPSGMTKEEGWSAGPRHKGKDWQKGTIREQGIVEPSALEQAHRPKEDINKLLDLKSQWCYLLKESKTLTHEKAQLLSRKGEDMAEALKFLYELSAENRRWAEQQAIEKHERDQRAEKEYVFDEGLEKGRKEGMQKGMQKERQVVALNMLKKQLDFSLISEVTGLSEEEIKKLKNGSCSK